MTRVGAVAHLAFLLFTACGGKDGDTNNNGNQGDGGTTTRSACCLVDLANMVADCVPSGACVYQKTAAGGAFCFDNGVKQSVVKSSSSGGSSTTTTLKKNGRVCLSMQMKITKPENGDESVTTTYKDSGGATVVTMESTGATQSVTCPGQAPGFVDPSCADKSTGPSSTSFGSTKDCTEGSCSF